MTINVRSDGSSGGVISVNGVDALKIDADGNVYVMNPSAASTIATDTTQTTIPTTVSTFRDMNGIREVVLNPTQASPVTLSRFDVIHRYSYTGQNRIPIGTKFSNEIGQVYEMIFAVRSLNGTSGAINQNIDPQIRPNFETYPGRITTNGQFIVDNGTNPVTTSTFRHTNVDLFQFDHVGGVRGDVGLVKMVIMPHTSSTNSTSKVLYQGGDYFGSSVGSGVWRDDRASSPNTWDVFGFLDLYAATPSNPASIKFDAWIRRIA